MKREEEINDKINEIRKNIYIPIYNTYIHMNIYLFCFVFDSLSHQCHKQSCERQNESCDIQIESCDTQNESCDTPNKPFDRKNESFDRQNI